MENTSNGHTIVVQPAKQMMNGYAVGIMLLNTGFPMIPGNVANATTYDFPVRYRVIEGADSPALIGGDRSILPQIIAAAQALVDDGCKVVIGCCGYFARYQREIAEAVPVPVFISSLTQVPMITAGLSAAQKLGILCAKKSGLDAELLSAVGIGADAPIVVAGLEHRRAFREAILDDQGWMDLEAVEQEVLEEATALVRENPDISVLLLECSDLPPYAAAIQKATGLPVWDYTTLIRWAHSAMVRQPFSGHL